MQTMIGIPNGSIQIRRGSEGPRHDPYAFTEFTVERRGMTVKLHEGLGDWIKVAWTKEGKLVEVFRSTHQPQAYFEAFMGFPMKVFQRAMDKITNPRKCRVCGSYRLREESGYPGETFTVCDEGHIIGCRFNPRAVE